MLILHNNSVLKLPNNTMLTTADAPVDPYNFRHSLSEFDGLMLTLLQLNKLQ